MPNTSNDLIQACYSDQYRLGQPDCPLELGEYAENTKKSAPEYLTAVMYAIGFQTFEWSETENFITRWSTLSHPERLLLALQLQRVYDEYVAGQIAASAAEKKAYNKRVLGELTHKLKGLDRMVKKNQRTRPCKYGRGCSKLIVCPYYHKIEDEFFGPNWNKYRPTVNAPAPLSSEEAVSTVSATATTEDQSEPVHSDRSIPEPVQRSNPFDDLKPSYAHLGISGLKFDRLAGIEGGHEAAHDIVQFVPGADANVVGDTDAIKTKYYQVLVDVAMSDFLALREEQLKDAPWKEWRERLAKEFIDAKKQYCFFKINKKVAAPLQAPLEDEQSEGKCDATDEKAPLKYEDSEGERDASDEQAVVPALISQQATVVGVSDIVTKNNLKRKAAIKDYGDEARSVKRRRLHDYVPTSEDACVPGIRHEICAALANSKAVAVIPSFPSEAIRRHQSKSRACCRCIC